MRLHTLPFLVLLACSGGDKDTADSALSTTGTTTGATATGGTATGGTGTATGGTATGGSAPDGKELYLLKCSACHGETGEGVAAPSIVSELARSDAALIDVILNGDGSMPPIFVTPEEAQAIVDHMRATF